MYRFDGLELANKNSDEFRKQREDRKWKNKIKKVFKKISKEKEVKEEEEYKSPYLKF